jgi:hypothetical protein
MKKVLILIPLLLIGSPLMANFIPVNLVLVKNEDRLIDLGNLLKKKVFLTQ